MAAAHGAGLMVVPFVILTNSMGNQGFQTTLIQAGELTRDELDPAALVVSRSWRPEGGAFTVFVVELYGDLRGYDTNLPPVDPAAVLDGFLRR